MPEMTLDPKWGKEIEELKAKRTLTLRYTRLLTIMVMAIATAGVWVVTSQITPQKYASVKEEFFRQIEKQIVLGALKNTEDAEMVQVGVSREKDSEKLRLDDLGGLLAEYLVWVNLERASNEGQQVEKVQIVKVIIREVASEKPFSVLPEEDQLTAIELKNSIESGDKDVALSRMQLLTTSLGKEISSLRRKTESGWRWTIYSFIIGGIGVVVTIVLSLLYRGISRSREFDHLMAMFNNLRSELSAMQRRKGSE